VNRKHRPGRLLSIVAIALTFATSAEARPATPTNAMLVQLDLVIEHALEAGGAPGASVAIEWHGEVIYKKGFGYADLENHVPVTPDTVFAIGSITKTMTALAIHQLVAAGKVRLDASVGEYLPELAGPERNVKIRYLLDHTSGIVSYTDVPGFPLESQGPMSRKDVLGWFDSRPLQFAPGSRWSYTNSGFYLLGLVIEAVSGMSYEDYLQKNVFEPFGMTHSSLTSWRPLLTSRAHGYRRGRQGLENAPRYDPVLPFAAGAVLSTSGDLLNYQRGELGDASKSPALRNSLLVRDSLPDGFVLPYSLGALVFTTFNGHRRIGHPGDIFGFESQYSYYPDDDMTIVVLTNNQNASFPPISIEQKLARVLFGISQPNPIDASLDSSLANRLTGEYEVGDLRFGFDRIEFDFKDGMLQMAIGGKGAPLVALRYQGGKRFISSADDEQWVEFHLDKGATAVDVALYGFPLKLKKIQNSPSSNTDLSAP
jgi:D-alanyl-D-alanine carboxypeptidase